MRHTFHRKDLPAQAGMAGCSAAFCRPRRENAPGNEREILMMPARASAGNDIPSIFLETGKLCFPER